MTACRAHIGLKVKLASALLALGRIPYERGKEMSADEICAALNHDDRDARKWDELHGCYELWRRI